MVVLAASAARYRFWHRLGILVLVVVVVAVTADDRLWNRSGIVALWLLCWRQQPPTTGIDIGLAYPFRWLWWWW